MLLTSSLVIPAVAGGFISSYALSQTLDKSIEYGTGDVFKKDNVVEFSSNNKNGDDQKEKSVLSTPFLAETTKDVLSIAKSYFKIKYLIYLAIGYIAYDLIKE